jgi:hypothetical protein
MTAEIGRLGAWAFVLLAVGAGQAAAAPAKPGRVDSAKIRALLEQRRDALREVVKAHLKAFEAGRATLLGLEGDSRRLLRAELELARLPEQRIAAHRAHLELMRKCEKYATEAYDAGRVTVADFQRARAARMGAEIGWLRAGGKPKKKDK